MHRQMQHHSHTNCHFFACIYKFAGSIYRFFRIVRQHTYFENLHSLFSKFLVCLTLHSPVRFIKLDRRPTLKLVVGMWFVLSRGVVQVNFRLWNPSDVKILAIIGRRLRVRRNQVRVNGSNVWAPVKVHQQMCKHNGIIWMFCWLSITFSILAIAYSNWPHTTERGLVEELGMVVVEYEKGLDVFWEPRSRVAGGGEDTVLFSVWISLWGRGNERACQKTLHTS